MRYLHPSFILLVLALAGCTFAGCVKSITPIPPGEGGGSDSTGSDSVSIIQTFQFHGPSSYILKGDSLFVAGWNTYGQLGLGNTNNIDSFTFVTNGVTTVSAGYQHALLLKKDGTAWATGDNTLGELGTGNTTASTAWVQVMTGVRAIAAGDGMSFFIKTDNTLWGVANTLKWGMPDSVTPDYTPHHLMDSVLAVGAGNQAVMIIRTDNSLWSVGYDYDWQLGDGIYITDSATTDVAPMQIMTDVAAVSMNDYTAYILKTDQTLYTCGSNGDGQLGNGSFSEPTFPQQVLSGVRSVSAGYGCAMAIKIDSSVWVTGLDNWGQLGDGLGGAGGSVAYVTSFKQVFTGAASGSLSQSSIMLVKGDNSLWATGDNSYDNLGLYPGGYVLSFTEVPTKF
jgi:alpha-tubulin suppressor-like RCC1 family protein